MKTTTRIDVATDWALDRRIIAYPTEGVWGLGGLNLPKITKELIHIKSRPNEKKFILLFHSSEQLKKTLNINSEYFDLIEKHKHTFTTMIIPTATEKVAARIPGNSALLKFLKLINKPLISTSANISGEPVCKDIHEIKKVFDGKIYGALDAPLGGENQPSKIIDLEKNEYIR